MSLINVTNLTFSYDGNYDTIFENVSFQIDTDWKLGFTGRNGRGKTTFLNLLLGKYEYTGNISNNVNFEYFPYEVEEQENFTIDVIKEISPNSMDWEIVKELSMLDIDDDILYRQFYTLSKGEQTKALLAAMFLKENSFLLIDEPTNHLDAEARKKLSNYLRKKKGFILISHDRAFLDNCIDHVLSINKTDIEIQKGDFSSWWENKKRQDGYELAENEKLRKDINRLSESAKRTSSWSNEVEKSKKGTTNSGSKLDKGYVGHKAAKMMKRSKSIESRRESSIEEKSKLLKNIESSDSLKISQLSYHKNKLVELEKVSIFYGDTMVCKDISFSIEQGERISLKGKNGSGKSSIIKLICDENIKYTGTFRKGSELKISYVSQDTSYLKGNLTNYALENSIDESLFKAILRKLDFSREQFEKDISSFSGGQKKKVLIAKSLCEKAHLYIWDEPLNFIDVISRMQIEDLLLEYSPTLLFVEHDSEFCKNVATKIVEL
ncbi:Lsa family ABC-F type ribosomal protection protein [Clostridium beijerinckii]|uniref:Lincosamide and streptogramin A transport system ATP-binding/permease protein n=1 Tax=Clostridium beijerinckii TaxID=1520 RepID=A0A9Q5GII8_CLOBE|nr:Lsa family ABC-F type ribosomal protection protein [Clostridium beijerinckii]AQS05836.1 putative ABC transporter ATP-binding protein YbiT [Clostridium beijerinckii]MBA2885467.1 lincosamide and streptogramin A transport system ATP-binding/permease protein [Clostridium beijerinckii]MBA2900032.1 lincosamide and streptogramin A transport system ATP-binding/permease protein [Clostridium beijerinckii]MBA2909661.1 lincosamide and streptogramin A transport system ATP-binding/permease protein [Clostr